jgi:hypothetical protein
MAGLPSSQKLGLAVITKSAPVVHDSNWNGPQPTGAWNHASSVRLLPSSCAAGTGFTKRML